MVGEGERVTFPHWVIEVAPLGATRSMALIGADLLEIRLTWRTGTLSVRGAAVGAVVAGPRAGVGPTVIVLDVAAGAVDVQAGALDAVVPI